MSSHYRGYPAPRVLDARAPVRFEAPLLVPEAPLVVGAPVPWHQRYAAWGGGVGIVLAVVALFVLLFLVVLASAAAKPNA
jgi:hypothetical protein